MTSDWANSIGLSIKCKNVTPTAHHQNERERDTRRRGRDVKECIKEKNEY